MQTSFLPEGGVQPAIEAAQKRVKAEPTNVSHRFELAELLLLMGAFERADNQFDLVSTQDPTFGLRVALVRQLIRGELARREVFDSGRTPEVIGDADPEVAVGLKILLEQRSGGDAASLRVEADDAVVPLIVDVDGRKVELVRDLDDRTADVLEVVTSTGKYFWIPWRRVRSLELQPPEHVRDIIWRAANLDVEDGPEGVVYIPTTYVADLNALNDAQRLGRETDWIDAGGLTQGVGLRCLMLGDDVVSMADFTSLAISARAES